MSTADCIDSLHRAMCDTFNADYVTETTKSDQHMDEDKTLVKATIAQAETILSKVDNTSIADHAEYQKQIPVKKDEALVMSSEPTMELLFSSMSSTFDAECATGTDEAGSLLNHDLAEDKTIKWRNLVNNKFAYKDNISYKRGRRVKKQTTNSTSKSSICTNRNNNNINSRQKASENQTKRSEGKLEQSKILVKNSSKSQPASTSLREESTPSAEYMEEQIKTLLSDDEDSQQLSERNESYVGANELFKADLTVCKEEIIVGDDDILLLDADAKMMPVSRKIYSDHDNSYVMHLKEHTEETHPDEVLIKLETIKQDIDDSDDNLMVPERKSEPSELAVKDVLARLTNKSTNEAEFSHSNESMTHKTKPKTMALVSKVIGKSKRKRKIRK